MRFELATALDILRRTPDTLRALLDGAGDAWTRGNEGPDTFSPFDVVGHLIDGEETDWMPRARIILTRNPEATFTPYDRFRHYERNRGRSLASLLDELARLRAANLEALAAWNLGDAELELRAMHPSLGAVTLRQLLATWVAHDLGHIAQVARVMAKQYRDEVGPWLEYLPVLTDHEAPRS
jgi:DinB superfamily